MSFRCLATRSLRALPRRSMAVHATRSLSATSGIHAQLNRLVEGLPLMETVFYPQQEYKWSYKKVQEYSDALTAGLLESKYGAGDVVAAWLPENTAEALVLKLAVARLGMLLVEIDMSISDPLEIRAILKESNAKSIFFDLEAGDRHNLDILNEAVPELAHYDDAFGAPFRSREVPSLKMPVHVNGDLVPGITNFRFLLSFDIRGDNLPALPEPNTPLYVRYDSDASGKATKGKVLNEKDVLAEKAWPVVSAMLAKTHMTVA